MNMRGMEMSTLQNGLGNQCRKSPQKVSSCINQDGLQQKDRTSLHSRIVLPCSFLYLTE